MNFNCNILKASSHPILKIICLSILVFVIVNETNCFDVFDLLNETYIIIIIALLVIWLYIYLAITNNDIYLGSKNIIISRRFPLFQRSVSIKYNDIQKIILRHDWTETAGEGIKSKFIRYLVKSWIMEMTLPLNYKWIEITTQTQRVRYFCFGLEYDYYDNPLPHFDDLYFELAKRGLSVEWTHNTDPYYKDLERRKNEMLKK